MERAAWLLGAALLACTPPGRDPALYPLTGRDPDTRAPKRALTEAELQAFIEQGIGEIASGLEPLCGSGCRSLRALPAPNFDWPMALVGDESRREFVLVYRPDELQRMLANGESLALHGVAHELGHFIDVAIAGSALDEEWRGELSADVVAGCAFGALRFRVDLVRATMMAAIAPGDSLESRLDLVCGSDHKHPAIRWQLAAFDTGWLLCRDGVVPLDRLENEADDLTRDAKRAAEKAKVRLPRMGDPCRWRHLQTQLHNRRRPQTGSVEEPK